MEKLIARRWRIDNSIFIRQYISEDGYDNLQTHQLQFLLRLAGRNSEVFLQILIKQIRNRKFLDNNTRYLLSNMNFGLCANQNHALYRDMIKSITKMPEISHEDLKLVLELSADSVERRVDTGDCVHMDSTNLYSEEWDCLFRHCTTFKDLIETVKGKNSKGQITFMQAVIDLSAKFLQKNPPSDEEAVEYVEILEDVFINLSLHKVPKAYIDSIISIIQKSDKEAKDPAINMLKLIRKNRYISSKYPNILLIGEEFSMVESTKTHSSTTEPTSTDQVTREKVSKKHQRSEHEQLSIGAKMKSLLFTTKKTQDNNSVESNKNYKSYNYEARYFKFEFEEPNHPSCCNATTRCGFIVKFTRDGVDFNWELCKEPEIYRGSGIHVDDFICVEDMYLYWIVPGAFTVEIEGEVTAKTKIKTMEISVPARWGWWCWFDGSVDARKIEKLCVEYNNIHWTSFLAKN